MGSPSVKVAFLGDATNLARAARRADGDLGKVGSKVDKVSAGFGKMFGALAGAAAGAGIVSGLKSAVDAAVESQKISKLTAQVIKTTGKAAKITADQVGDLATAISNKTGVDDEAIQSGANLLLTFTNVRNEVGKGNDIFNQATQTITDMSVALGQDTKASAIQLGKALNDPIKGVTALSKVGVSFTEQQKKQIKTLVDSGKTLEAQKVILKELGREFGGAAEAAATPMDKLKVAAGNLQEKVGTLLLPVVEKFAVYLNDKAVPAIAGLLEGFQDRTGAGGKFRDVLEDLARFAKSVGDFLLPIGKFLVAHPDMFRSVAIGAALLATAFKLQALYGVIVARFMPGLAVSTAATGVAAGTAAPRVAALALSFKAAVGSATLLLPLLVNIRQETDKFKKLFDDGTIGKYFDITSQAAVDNRNTAQETGPAVQIPGTNGGRVPGGGRTGEADSKRAITVNVYGSYDRNAGETVVRALRNTAFTMGAA